MSTEDDTYTVSTVVPVYNSINTIEKCLISLINQTYPIKEIIVVDDASTDGTGRLLQTMARRYNLILYSLAKNQGAAHARNEGLSHTSGQIIFFAEADAYYAPDYLELCTRLLRNPVYGTAIGAMHAWPDASLWYKWHEALRRVILSNYKIVDGWLFRKADLTAIGGYKEELLVGEDVELCIRLKNTLGLKFGYAPNALWYHRSPDRLRSILRKEARNARNSVNFKKISSTHRRALITRILYIIFLAVVACSLALAVFSRVTVLFSIPALALILGFAYPIYQLESKKLKLREFGVYVALFPFTQGLILLTNSIFYLQEAIRQTFGVPR